MSEPLIALRGIRKHYTRGKQTVEVLQSLDLDIAQGDFVALMGPSGSGKTTLLNLIGGLDQPSDGSLSIDGVRVDQLSAAALARWRAAHVGFVFQFYNLLPMISAARNVELPLLLTRLGRRERAERVAVALEAIYLPQRGGGSTCHALQEGVAASATKTVTNLYQRAFRHFRSAPELSV